ncbi:Uncharacterized protein F383_01924 [Gossypium arboreum]|uniref:Uncharacterized protein n=1 Tax=Gossypium arboreum TaxID=29729 RepID=A0A0B0P0J7_GOSAR|nr:Uncharacterized protein F383_01924 [Gossypium arboreum]
MVHVNLGGKLAWVRHGLGHGHVIPFRMSTRIETQEKLKEKKEEYEAIASTDSSVNLENIDNRIITEVLGPESQAQAEVQRLRDQIAQMQANTVEQIVEVERKYEELQQQLRVDAAAREAAATTREAEAAVIAAEQSKKYDELQL